MRYFGKIREMPEHTRRTRHIDIIFIPKIETVCLRGIHHLCATLSRSNFRQSRQSFKASQTLEQNSCGLQAEWSPLDICREVIWCPKKQSSWLVTSKFFSQHQSWYTTATCKRGAQRRNWVNAPTQLRQGVWGTTNSTCQGAPRIGHPSNHQQKDRTLRYMHDSMTYRHTISNDIIKMR